jgi:predicted phosphodiesterase
MRYGILADVHANLPALESTLLALASQSVDRYLLAGDLVGYGPHPNECVEVIAGFDPICVAGNHDLMAVGKLSDERCIPIGQAAMRWTRSVLRDDARRYLEALPLKAEAEGGVVLAHGSLDDPEEYTTNTAEAQAQLTQLGREWPGRRVLVLGHTHRPLVVSSSGSTLGSVGQLAFVAGERCLANPGAVGQARELRARARFGVLDLEAAVVELYAVPYDVAACRRALRRAGLSPRSPHLRPTAVGAARRALRLARLARSGRAAERTR